MPIPPLILRLALLGQELPLRGLMVQYRGLWRLAIGIVGILLSTASVVDAQAPTTTSWDTSARLQFGGSFSSITQPQAAPQWAPSDAKKTLQGRLQQDGAWYTQSMVTGSPWRPMDGPTRLAETMARQNKLDAAEAKFKALLRQNPNNAGAHHGLALVTYYRTGSSDGFYRTQQEALLAEAIQHAMAALRLKPTYVDAHMTLAKLYAERLNRQPDAEEFAANAYALAPNNSQVLTLVGQLLLDSGDATEATAILQEAARANTRNAEAYTQLGRALAATGQLHDALQSLNTALWLQPANAPANHLAATLYETQHNETAALESYKKALAADPEYLPASLDLANLNQRRSDWAQAQETLKNAYHGLMRQQHPARNAMALGIADAALANRQPEVAAAYYREVLSRTKMGDADHWEASQGLSRAETRTAQETLTLASGYGGDLLSTAQAHTALQQAMQANRGNTQAKLIQTKLRGSHRALATIPEVEQTDILKTPPLTANDALALGEVLSARFDPVRAQAAYMQAARSADTVDDAIHVGETLLTLGQPDAARVAFERVKNNELSLKPAQPTPVNRYPKATSLTTDTAQLAATAGLAQLTKHQQQAVVLNTELAQFKTDDPRYEATLQRLLQLNATDAATHQRLAHLYEQRQQWVEALRHYHVFAELAPTHPQAPQARQRVARFTKQLVKTAQINTDQPNG